MATTASHTIKLAQITGLGSLSACENKQTAKTSNLRFFQFQLEDGTAISLISFPVAGSLQLTVRQSTKPSPTSVQARAAGASAAVNGGYFNLSDGVGASYVVQAGDVTSDPTKNVALTGNPKLQPYLKQIFDRSELRILESSHGALSYAIARHSEPVANGLKLCQSLGGGPRLLPKLTAEAEAFLRTEADGSKTDSIGVLRTAARTAVGLTGDGQVLVISVAGKKQSEFSAGLNLAALADLLKRLGAVEAINFDGGTSTTMIVGGGMVNGLHPETLVKSALCLVEKKQ